MRDAPTLLRRLVDRGVRFVLVGGFPSVAHGSTLVTRDITGIGSFDACLRRSEPLALWGLEIPVLELEAIRERRDAPP